MFCNAVTTVLRCWLMIDEGPNIVSRCSADPVTKLMLWLFYQSLIATGTETMPTMLKPGRPHTAISSKIHLFSNSQQLRGAKELVSAHLSVSTTANAS